ncbi:MAG: hypothetical protein ABW067_05625 [Rhizobacter sp.]
MAFKARYLGGAVLVIAGVAALGGMVMLLWNAVVPVALPDARTLDYPHALGLLVLCRILFGGFRGHGGWRGHRGRWARWEAMSEEERAQFRLGRRGRCGRPDPGAPAGTEAR